MPLMNEWKSASRVSNMNYPLTVSLSSIILDGEMLVWDPVSERNLPFGTLKTAALGMLHLLLELKH